MKKIIRTLNDLKIFKAFRGIDINKPKKGISSLDGVTIKEIRDYTKLSEKKIRDIIKLGIENGLIKEGLMNVRTKTYYLTEEGLKEVFEINHKNSGEFLNLEDEEIEEGLENE